MPCYGFLCSPRPLVAELKQMRPRWRWRKLVTRSSWKPLGPPRRKHDYPLFTPLLLLEPTHWNSVIYLSLPGPLRVVLSEAFVSGPFRCFLYHCPLNLFILLVQGGKNAHAPGNSTWLFFLSKVGDGFVHSWRCNATLNKSCIISSSLEDLIL